MSETPVPRCGQRFGRTGVCDMPRGHPPIAPPDWLHSETIRPPTTSEPEGVLTMTNPETTGAEERERTRERVAAQYSLDDLMTNLAQRARFEQESRIPAAIVERVITDLDLNPDALRETASEIEYGVTGDEHLDLLVRKVGAAFIRVLADTEEATRRPDPRMTERVRLDPEAAERQRADLERFLGPLNPFPAPDPTPHRELVRMTVEGQAVDPMIAWTVIAQPNGMMAIFNVISGTFDRYEATPDEVLQTFRAYAQGGADYRARELITNAMAGNPVLVTDWEALLRSDQEHGGDTWRYFRSPSAPEPSQAASGDLSPQESADPAPATRRSLPMSRNGQDPETYCTTCHRKIKTSPSGNESGHADDCEWNPKNQS